MMRVKKRFNC